MCQVGAVWAPWMGRKPEPQPKPQPQDGVCDITQEEIDAAAHQEMVVQPLREEISRLEAERDGWRKLALQNEETAREAVSGLAASVPSATHL